MANKLAEKLGVQAWFNIYVRQYYDADKKLDLFEYAITNNGEPVSQKTFVSASDLANTLGADLHVLSNGEAWQASKHIDPVDIEPFIEFQDVPDRAKN